MKFLTPMRRAVAVAIALVSTAVTATCLLLGLTTTAISEGRVEETEKVILVGSWVGGGTVAMGSGDHERARCHAEYVARSETTYFMKGTCVIASGNVSQTALLPFTKKGCFARSSFCHS